MTQPTNRRLVTESKLATDLAGKADSAALSGKADKVGGVVPDAQLPTRLSAAELRAAATPVPGTFAGRPSAASATSPLYFATDDNGGTLYKTDGTAWVKVSPGVSEASGQIIGPAKLGTSIATGSIPLAAYTASPRTLPATAYDMGMSITVTGNGRAVEVCWGGGVRVYNGVANGFGGLHIALVDAADTTKYLDLLAYLSVIPTTPANNPSKPSVKHYLDTALAAGASRTYKLYCYKPNNSGYDTTIAAQVLGGDSGMEFSLHARLG